MIEYFKDHWFGRLPLWESYWINGIILSTLIALTIGFLFDLLLGLIELSISFTFSLAAINLMSTMLVAIPICTWSYVGMWRAGKNYTSAHPNKFWCWGRITQFQICLAILYILIHLFANLTIILRSV